MKDSCFIRMRSGLSSQEPGVSSHLKWRSSTALQNQWHHMGRLKPLFPLQLFCCSVVVGRLWLNQRIILSLISEIMPSLTLWPVSLSFFFSFLRQAASISSCSFGSSRLPWQLQHCIGATSLCCRWNYSGLFSENYGLEPGSSKFICRLMVK